MLFGILILFYLCHVLKSYYRNKMKKVFALLVSAAIFGFVACGESTEEKAAKEKVMADSIAAAQADSIAQAAEAAAMAADSTMADSANVAK